MAITTKTPTLEDRVKQIKAEIDELIDKRAAELCTENPGVPQAVIRRSLEANEHGCLCNVFAAMKAKGEL